MNENTNNIANSTNAMKDSNIMSANNTMKDKHVSSHNLEQK